MSPTYYSGQHNGDFRDYRANFGYKNTLRSNQFLTIFDVLSEGEIAGPANAVKKALFAARYPNLHQGNWGVGTDNYNREALTDVFLNETPINGAPSSSSPVGGVMITENVLIDNFGEVENEFKYGTANQSVVSKVGISSTQTTANVQTEIKQDSPHIVQISTPYDTTGTDIATGSYPIRITITWPTLYRQKHDTGSSRGVTVSYRIEYKYKDDVDYTNPFQHLQVQGKSKGPYSRDHKIMARKNPDLYPLSIKVTRITEDNKTDGLNKDGSHYKKDSIQSPMVWSTYTLIRDDNSNYPNTAYHALVVDAERFGGQPPARMYKIRGLKTRIPAPYTDSNGVTYTPAVDPLTGRIEYDENYVFQGSFTTATHWNSDPAMLLREILLNERFGLGEFIKENQISNYDFYTVSKYNSELITTRTGVEPRFSFNGSLQRQDNAFNVINRICSNMRVTPYWSNNSLRLIQDSPQNTSYLFTLSNVVEGGFSYSGTPQDTKFTVVNVSFFNMNTYKKDIEQVTDETTAPQSKYGIVSKNVEAVGCTSRQQAHRMGRALLYSQTHENEVCSFTTSIAAGVVCRPGQVIEIADPMRQGERTAGLIKSATATQTETTITIDSNAKSYGSNPASLVFSSGSELSIVLPNGTVETKPVSGISSNIITINGVFSVLPQSNNLWVYKTGTLTTATWKVVSVTEKDDFLYDVTCIPYNSGKYQYIEQNIELPERKTSILNVIPQPPSNLELTEDLVEINDTVINRITLTWDRPSDTTNQTQFLIQYRTESDNYTRVTTTDTTIDIDGVENGLFECKVYSMAQSGIVSGSSVDLSTHIVGKTAVPAAPTNVHFSNGVLSWSPSTDLDVKIGGTVYFKWTSRTTGATWANSTTLIDPLPGASTQVELPSLPGTVLIAFEDSGGRLGAVTNTPLVDYAPTPVTVAIVWEHPGFSGAKTNLEVNSNKLRLTTTDNFDSITDFNNLTIAGTNVETLDEVGSGVYNTGEYLFAATRDFGAGNILPVRFKQILKTANVLAGATIGDRGTNIDEWTTFDGDVAYTPDASILVDSTDDDPASGSATWKGYQKMTNTLLQGRGFRFKADVTTADSSENIEIEQLGYSVHLDQSIQQSSTAVTSGTGAKTITFDKAFSSLYTPVVTPIGIGMATGDYYELSVTSTNFTVTFKNSSGSAISKDFHWTATGYGQAV